ncbi:hypothetical protein D6853_08115 [Butyrivibrio sp. X503]|uniref:hypothetical protein n=1 Tax=Butyrivibrio sp. X503 TaxID=2364878 RepID=UPI000EA9078A|nr:hypothetical protein [Butyrivibrio sp. X503]RKM55518.1 hypothetical protein D6853_08115 [Butyrivibrio sp. X503]
MKKSGVKVLAGIATAGMLAVTGASGLQTIAWEMPTEITESVEYKMEENDSSLISKAHDETYKYYVCNKKIYKDPQLVDTFDKAINVIITNRERYALVNIKGYGKKVLIHAMEENSDSTETHHIKVYTEQGKGKPLRMVGELKTNMAIKIKDGVIYACNARSYETYLVTPDGRSLVHKDYIDYSNWYGYTNTSASESTRKKFTGKNKEATELVNKTYKIAYNFNFAPGCASS